MSKESLVIFNILIPGTPIEVAVPMIPTVPKTFTNHYTQGKVVELKVMLYPPAGTGIDSLRVAIPDGKLTHPKENQVRICIKY